MMDSRVLVIGLPWRAARPVVEGLLRRHELVILIGSAAPAAGDLEAVRAKGVVNLEVDFNADDAWDRAREHVRGHTTHLDGVISFVDDSALEAPSLVSPQAWSQALDRSLGAVCLSHRMTYPLLSQSRGAPAVAHVAYGDGRSRPSVVGAGLASLTCSVALQWAKRKPAIRVNMIQARDLDESILAPLNYLLSDDADFVTAKVLSH